MPSFAASSAAWAAKSTDSRSTPGMEAMGTRLFSPSITNSGQMKSAGESAVSATSARDQAWRRKRRMRRAGKEDVFVMAGGF